uniref:WW domain containing transcription regulator 1 n=1 Tax=Meleagris gallopavo TaxID=9103 RepID=A0A803XMJ6_MELGA
TMNQPLNHVSHHPAAASTPVPQRSMAVSQPNLGEYWISFLWRKYEQEGRAIFYCYVSQSNFCFRKGSSDSVIKPNSIQKGPYRPPSPNPLCPSQTPQPGLLNMPSALTAQQQQQQKLRLQRIQMERERIRMRQEELMRQVTLRIHFYFAQELFFYQEAALCRQLPMDSENMTAVQTAMSTAAMTQDMRSITNNGSDPFLNSGPYHSREQSTDSGLGLGCYSIPTTPEDFLSNVDEMDTGETVAQTTMNINAQQARFPDFLDCLPGTNVDLGTLESEDLIPILNDVESVLSKNEPFLTWL